MLPRALPLRPATADRRRPRSGALAYVAGALQQSPSAAYIAKYNRFVDTILERVNKILRRSYDPVNVRLTPGEKAAVKTAEKQKKKKKKNKTKQQQRNGNAQIMAKTDEDA